MIRKAPSRKSERRLRVLLCGARRLGMDCLKLLHKHPNVDLVAAVVPRRTDKVWWKDVVDEDVVDRLKIPCMDWDEATQMDNLDLVFSVLHAPIFKDPFLSRVRHGILNLHPAPLPEYRGCNSYSHAIMNGDTTYRVTLHYVEAKVDTGPIVGQSSLAIRPNDTAWDLYQRAQAAALKLFSKHLPGIIRAALKGIRVAATEQDPRLARYYHRNSLENKEIDLTWPREKIYNYVRALQFAPFEPAFFSCGDRKCHLHVQDGRIILDLDR